MAPNPGSDAAIERGCTCPVMDNHRGQGIPTDAGTCFYYSGDCPVHSHPVTHPTQGGGQLSGNTGELAEAVEIVTEWLAMAEAVPTQTHGVLRYPPICQGELDAIKAILAPTQKD
jgi:hypothetical protein